MGLYIYIDHLAKYYTGVYFSLILLEFISDRRGCKVAQAAFMWQQSIILKNRVGSTTSDYCTVSSRIFSVFLLHHMGDTPSEKKTEKTKKQHIRHSLYDSTAFFRMIEVPCFAFHLIPLYNSPPLLPPHQGLCPI
jgi:hypothetical protein